MSDEIEMNAPKTDPAHERVGDILRKERITRRIALETIAKDLKLNVKYIRALESNEYQDLPAAPYIRVYLRSIAKYLLLDPEDILKKVYEERGVGEEKYQKDTDSKIVISMSMTEKKNESKPWLIILIAIIALAVISIVAKKIGSDSSSQSVKTSSVTNGNTIQKGQLSSTVSTDPVEDSLLGSFIAHEVPSVDSSKAIAAKIPVKDTSTMTFEMRVIKDSVWVQVFSDGVSWKNWIKSSQVRKFTAKDSFNIHVGNNRRLQYTYNGKILAIPAIDVAIFKLSHTLLQPEIWTIAKWNTVFKNRL